MERKKQNILIVLIAAVIVVAVFSSFGLNLFAADTAQIILPTPVHSGTAPGEETAVGDLILVELTPQTVQNVILTLSRPNSYYREVTIEDFWGENQSGSTTAKVWSDGGWTYTRTEPPGGRVRHSIVGNGQVWIWYEGSRRVLNGSADAYSADLEGQRIPTYEDILSLETDCILATDYVELGGLSCVYVETGPDDIGYHQRYWVSVESGLLVCAETVKQEQVVYRMSSYSVERPIPEGTDFCLPDGTQLHVPGGES